ncbi:MAG: type II toxin-antitoxin system VapC family toxin [Gemmatimonadetes bacterium]|nr:type II toxin-antitoxin system VapC family toxin [Gemmatimonadota bacterium]
MRFLLDTNVLSEAAKPRPDPSLLEWLLRIPTLDLAISVLTIGEIQKGVSLLPEGAKRERLAVWVSTELPRQFQDRVLPIDQPTAIEWGRLSAEARARGRDLPVIDGLLLATAATRGLVFVTRNERDCAGRGVSVLNPWGTPSGEA